MTRELLELARELRRVVARFEDVDLERACRRGRGIALRCCRQRLERARDVSFTGRVLGDAHRERRRDAAVGLADHALLREIGRERRVAHLLGEAEARRQDEALEIGDVSALFAGCRLVFARRVLFGEDLERAIEILPRGNELSRAAPRVGSAEEHVDDVVERSAPAWCVMGVTVRGVRHCGAEHVGARFEGGRRDLLAIACVLRACEPRLGAYDVLDRRRGRPRGGAAVGPHAVQDPERPLDLATLRGEPCGVDREKSFPRRIDGEVRASVERVFALCGVAELCRDDLQGQPRGSEVGGYRAGLGRFACCAPCAFEILLDVVGEDRSLGERPRAFLRRDRGLHEGLDQLAEVLHLAAPLEHAHEALERLTEARVRVVRRQVVARGARLVAAAFLDLARLVEEARPARLVGRRVDLVAEPRDGGCDRLDRLDRGRGELRRARDVPRRGNSAPVIDAVAIAIVDIVDAVDLGEALFVRHPCGPELYRSAPGMGRHFASFLCS